jgi:hypothetical protein
MYIFPVLVVSTLAWGFNFTSWSCVAHMLTTNAHPAAPVALDSRYRLARWSPTRGRLERAFGEHSNQTALARNLC